MTPGEMTTDQVKLTKYGWKELMGHLIGPLFITADEMVNSLEEVLGILIRIAAQKSQGSTQYPLPQFPLGSSHSFTNYPYCHFYTSRII